MAPYRVTLYDSLPEMALPYMALDRGYVCTRRDQDDEVIAAFRLYFPGKLFNKRKISNPISEAIRKVADILQDKITQFLLDKTTENAQSALDNIIEEAHAQIDWASNLPVKVFGCMIQELASARWQYRVSNTQSWYRLPIHTRACKLLDALGYFLALVQQLEWEWEYTDGETPRVKGQKSAY